MPALPSRLSTTLARRCAASCTDRTPAPVSVRLSRPQPQQIEGSDSGPLPRCSALCLQLSPGGCLLPATSRSYPNDPVTARSGGNGGQCMALSSVCFLSEGCGVGRSVSSRAVPCLRCGGPACCSRAALSARRSAGTVATHKNPVQAAMLAVIVIEAGFMQRGAIMMISRSPSLYSCA
jgi:hypothetical protein